MLALSIAEGFARTHFRFHPACSHASSRPFLSRLFPLHTTAPLAIPLFPLLTQKQGVAPPKKCRRADICSLFSPIPPSWISFLQLLAHSFIFRITPIPYPSNTFRTLCRKTGGTPHSGHTNASDGPCLSLRNLFSAFRLSVLCVSAVSPSSLYSPPATSFPCHSPFTSAGTKTSRRPEAAACSSDASVCGGRRRALRPATAGLGRRGGRGGR